MMQERLSYECQVPYLAIFLLFANKPNTMIHATNVRLHGIVAQLPLQCNGYTWF